MRGVIELPVEKGRKELCWYVGTAPVAGLNTVNPVINMKTERDADFIAKRLFCVQWPSFGGAIDPNLALPLRTTAVLRDGGTKRGLALVATLAETIFKNANPARMMSAYLGLPSPFLIRGNANLFAELSNAGAAGTAWTGDLYLIAEGYKVFPYLPEEIPAKIQSYAVPFDLDGNLTVGDPSLASGNVRGQSIAITNNGEGKFIAKSLSIKIMDSAYNDKTAAVLPCLAFGIKDSTSGGKLWIQNTTPGQTVAFCPASILSMGMTDLPFNSPRYIDPNGVVNIQVVFPEIAAALTYLNSLGNWPYTFSVTLKGALLPA